MWELTKHSPPRTIADSIADLVSNMKEKFPDTKVGISALLHGRK
jgi:hypothetical protein